MISYHWTDICSFAWCYQDSYSLWFKWRLFNLFSVLNLNDSISSIRYRSWVKAYQNGRGQKSKINIQNGIILAKTSHWSFQKTSKHLSHINYQTVRAFWDKNRVILFWGDKDIVNVKTTIRLMKYKHSYRKRYVVFIYYTHTHTHTHKKKKTNSSILLSRSPWGIEHKSHETFWFWFSLYCISCVCGSE